MNRIQLISYSLMSNGEYDQIIKKIESSEEVPEYIYNQAKSLTNVITIFDEDYPKQLLSLKYPPMVLYYKGNKELLKENKLAIIGSRNPTSYALNAVKLLCNQKKDKTVVSGLAKGIDAYAHENANKTIAVLGCGIDYIYPQCNFDLFKQIEKEGLIISEYPFNTKPLGFHFPFRNRIIVALSTDIYVAECKEKSGTMTAINEALELGSKNLRILPFDIFTAQANKVYNNTLIDNGAQLWNIQC